MHSHQNIESTIGRHPSIACSKLVAVQTLTSLIEEFSQPQVYVSTTYA